MQRKVKESKVLAPEDLAFLIKIAKGVDDLTSLVAQINKRVYAMEESKSEALNRILNSTQSATNTTLPVKLNCTFDTPEEMAQHQASLEWLENAINVFVNESKCQQFWVSFVNK